MSDEDAADIARERQYWLEQLAAIPAKRKQLEQDERETVWQARFAGITWEDIAEAVGSKYPAAMRQAYGEPGPGDMPF